MSVNFVTRKLKTHSLTDNTPDGQSDSEDKSLETTTEDSGMGSSRGRPSLATLPSLPTNDSFELPSVFSLPPVMTPINGNFTKPLLPEHEGYSSEEELKEIISSKPQKKLQKISTRTKRTSSSIALTSRSGMYSSSASSNGSRSCSRNKNVLGSCTNSAGQPHAEKRKWSEVSDYDSAGSDVAYCSTVRCRSSGGTLSAPANAPRIFSSFSCSSTCSSSQPSDEMEDPEEVATPVQFCTSPPVDVHRPKRQAIPALPTLLGRRSPPAKLLHFQPSELGFVNPTQRVNGQAMISYSGNVVDQDLDAEVCAVVADDSDGRENNVRKAMPSRRSNSHHRTTRRSSSVKHHRLRRHLQRPCLDFEKMQQIKRRVVTSWRPQGGELSLFCW